MFGVLICLKHILPADRHWIEFVDTIELLFEKYPNVEKSTMGFPTNWMDILKKYAWRSSRHTKICHNEIDLKLRVLVIKECIHIMLAKIGFNAANGKFHLHHLPCSEVRILHIHGDILDIPCLIFHELRGPNEHPNRTAARVYFHALFIQCIFPKKGLEWLEIKPFLTFPAYLWLVKRLFSSHVL